MRHNLPISNVEYALPEGDVIITRTDLDGNIVYANDAFLRASGYSRDEVLGEPQNIVRHPEMPALAFADMWATVRSNRPWAGIVKNRRKDGGFYWVAANVTPLFEAGRKVGYMSVRTTPSRAQIVAATRLYAKLNGQPRTQIRIAGGAVLRSGLAGMLDRLLRLPVAWRLCFIMSTLIVLFLVQALSANHSWLPGLTAPQQTGLLAAVGVALCAASAIYLIHHVLLPLRQLNDAARAVLFGQIRSAFPERGDEQTKILGRMLNQMNIKLVGVLIDTQASIDVIRDASSHLASGNADLAVRTDTQASAVEQTTTSLAQIAETAQQNALSAEQADQRGQHTAQAAETAAREVHKTVDVMAQVRAHSHKVVEITTVIDGIAFQTNIIALNAAVEAARAGTYGRGFAVVAAEVRSLAQRAASAAREIKALTESSLNTVDNAARIAGKAGDAMSQVEQAVTQLTATIRDIAQSSRTQSLEIGEINTAIEQVAELTQRNAALVDEAAAAAGNVQRQAQALEDAVAAFELRTHSMPVTMEKRALPSHDRLC